MLVRELMDATYEARRIQIMNDPTIEATLKIYPALKLVSVVHVIHPLYTAVEHDPMQTRGMLLDLPKAHVFATSLFASARLMCLDHTIQTQKTIWYALNNTIPQNPGTSCSKLG